MVFERARTGGMSASTIMLCRPLTLKGEPGPAQGSLQNHFCRRSGCVPVARPPTYRGCLCCAGMVCLELLKVVQDKPLEAYRNSFANLAVPVFAMAEPIPPKQFTFGDLSWTLWDRWVLEGDLTVQQVLDWFVVSLPQCSGARHACFGTDAGQRLALPTLSLSTPSAAALDHVSQGASTLAGCSKGAVVLPCLTVGDGSLGRLTHCLQLSSLTNARLRLAWQLRHLAEDSSSLSLPAPHLISLAAQGQGSCEMVPFATSAQMNCPGLQGDGLPPPARLAAPLPPLCFHVGPCCACASQ